MKPLSTRQRQYLKGLAHRLQPVVMIGNQGLTPAVLKEIELALGAHELIKIKMATDDSATRDTWTEEICNTTLSIAVQRIGKVIVVYRPAATPIISLPQ